jgi:hypothetical protein
MPITPTITHIYDIHSVLSVCENKDFTEHFHDELCNSDYSYGNNGDTLIGARDFAAFFYETCEDAADVFPNGSINKGAINALLERMIAEDAKVPTFIGLGC